MLKADLQSEIKMAMKAKESIRLSTLRMLSSEIHNAEIDKGEQLSEKEELSVVRKEIKKRRDAIEAYAQAGRSELVEREEVELKVLNEFMPKQMSEEEVEKTVSQIISELDANSMSEMGRVIGAVMNKIGDRADGTLVSKIVKQRLSC